LPHRTTPAGYVGGAWYVKGTRILVNEPITNHNSGYYADELTTKLFVGLPIDLAIAIITYAAERS
jgi:hypothetical protein